MPTKFDKAELLRLVEETGNAAEVARILGCSRQLVYYHLGRAGFRCRTRRQVGALLRQGNAQEILRAYARTGNMAAAARELGLSRYVVRRRLAEHRERMERKYGTD